MHHEPIRATRRQTRLGEYVQVGEVYVPNRDIPESEWQGYPPEVRKAVRDIDLFVVKTDDDIKAEARAEPPDAAPADASAVDAAVPSEAAASDTKRGKGDK